MSPTLPAPLSLPDVDSIAVGGDHACAISDDKLFCWGSNAQLQFGTPDAGVGPHAMPIDASPFWFQFAEEGDSATVLAGGATTCLLVRINLIAGQAITCWGDNRKGQCGRNQTAQQLQSSIVVDGRPSPEPIDLPSVWGASVGEGHVCAWHDVEGVVEATVVNQISCWGSNEFGQLGVSVDVTASSGSPLRVGGTGDGTSQVVVGRDFSCMIPREDRSAVWCWGSNSFGQLGVADYALATNVPQSVAYDDVYRPCRSSVGGTLAPIGALCVTQISAGADHMCLLDYFGRVACWGNTQWASSQSTKHVPRLVPLAGEAISISSGDGFGCAVLQDGGTQCWGSNDQLQLGRMAGADVDYVEYFR